ASTGGRCPRRGNVRRPATPPGGGPWTAPGAGRPPETTGERPATLPHDPAIRRPPAIPARYERVVNHAVGHGGDTARPAAPAPTRTVARRSPPCHGSCRPLPARLPSGPG